jgi:hypothetical protein
VCVGSAGCQDDGHEGRDTCGDRGEDEAVGEPGERISDEAGRCDVGDDSGSDGGTELVECADDAGGDAGRRRSEVPKDLIKLKRRITAGGSLDDERR